MGCLTLMYLQKVSAPVNVDNFKPDRVVGNVDDNFFHVPSLNV